MEKPRNVHEKMGTLLGNVEPPRIFHEKIRKLLGHIRRIDRKMIGMWPKDREIIEEMR